MKIYPTLKVELTYQNCGSQWLIILQGKEEEIELTFNGLYNLCATAGRLRYTDHTRTQAIFWSQEKKMRRFFFNLDYHKNFNIKRARAFAESKLVELTTTSTQFFDFNKIVGVEGFRVGSNKAEKPNMDFKDICIEEGYKEKTNIQRIKLAGRI